MEMYLLLLLAAVLLWFFLPRRQYVGTVTALHALAGALRHPHLTGDLMKYHWQFLNPDAVENGKNMGFFLLMQMISALSGNNYQLLLAVIAVLSALGAGYVLGRFCPEPWLGFLAWNCLGFYIGSFSAIKQALAMALLLLAYVGMEEGNFRKFLFWTLLAGFVHQPALVFLPAYGLTRLRFDRWTAVGYLLTGAALWAFREEAVALVARLYYGEIPLAAQGGPGGRFWLFALILAAGWVIKGTENAEFSRLCHLMALGVLLQMLSVYGNLFTRLADYYLQFAILFLPQMLAEPDGAVLPFDDISRKLFRTAAALGLLWFYWHTCLNVPAAYSTDNYVNYQFFWEIRS